MLEGNENSQNWVITVKKRR